MKNQKNNIGVRIFYVLGVILAGAFLSVWMFFVARQWEIKQHKEEFDRLAGDRVHLFSERVKDHLETLYSIASFFASSDSIERDEFKTFAKNIFKYRSSITYMFWIQRVEGKDRNSFEQSMRKEGFTDFQIRSLDAEGNITKGADKPFYYPVTYIESNDNSYVSFGIDFLSDPVRRIALEDARDSGSLAMTSRIKRIGVKTENYSCLIACPVYRKGVVLSTAKQRQDNLLGFIALVFEIKQTLENSRRGLSPVGINIAIYDQSAPAGQQLLYYFKSPLSQPEFVKKTGRYDKLIKGFIWQNDFDFVDRHWLINAQAAPEFFVNFNFWQAWVILIIGLLLSLFLAITILSLLQRAEKIKFLVLQRTNELDQVNEALKREVIRRVQTETGEREAKDYLDKIINSVADPIFVKNKEHRFTMVNEALCKLLGYEKNQIIGKSNYDIFQKNEADVFQKQDDLVLDALTDNENEEFLTDKKGVRRIINTKKSLYIDKAGNKLIVGIIRDITQLKAIQEKVEQAAKDWEDTFNAISDLVFIQDTNFVIMKVNLALCKALKLKPEEIVGKKCHEIMHKTGAPWLNCPFQKTLTDKQPHTEEVDDAHLGVPLLVSTSPILGDKGELLGSVHIAKDISELKRAQEEIRNSEEKFRALYESSSDALMLLYENGEFSSCNQRTLEIFGFKDYSEFISKKPEELSPPLQPDGRSSAAFAREHIQTALQKGNESFTWVHQRKDGTNFDAEILLTSLLYKEKKMVQATVRDISQRIRMEEDLRRQKNEQQVILDSVPAMVFFKDKENRFIRTNKALEDTLGLPKDKFEGKSGFELYSPEEAEKYWKDDKEVIESGQPKLGIIEIMNTPKGIIWVETDKIPYRDALGKIEGIIGFSIDITERKKAQENLLKSREELVADKVKMESMVVSMAEGVIMLDEIGKIVILNPQARWMLGLGFHEEVNSDILFDKFKAIKLENAYQECLSAHRFISREVVNSAGHYLRCELNPVKNASMATIGTVIILRDITKEKEIDALKSEFVSTVSHELRTPLSITKEGISLVLDEIPGKINKKQEKILVTSRDNIDRLARIINSLLDISKIEAGKVELKREQVDIRNIAQKVAQSFELRIKDKGLRLKLNFSDKPLIAYVDPDKIIQVFTNLIGNAYKFTQTGSIEVSCFENGDKIECSVEDTGIGLAPDDLLRVFEKFQQFSRAPGAGEKGTGLGLSIAKAIIQMHKGKIRAESVQGKGSKFIFVLPEYSSEQLFKEMVKQGMAQATDKALSMSVVIVALSDFDKLRKEVPDDKVRSMLKGLEGVLKGALRREGDMVLKDTGEIIIVLIDCDKENVLRVEGRLEQAVSDYLMQQGLSEKVKLRLGASTYPEDARSEEELIKKAKL